MSKQKLRAASGHATWSVKMGEDGPTWMDDNVTHKKKIKQNKKNLKSSRRGSYKSF